MLLKLTDIFGQDAAVESIRRAYLANRLPHGLIFAGPAGVGKATTALALATLFLCENSGAKPGGDVPCGQCKSCEIFQHGSHPDLHIITKELIRYHDKTGKSKGVDLSIHVIQPELIDRAGIKPTMNRGKVFVIEQADLMNAQAQNSMLKSLEEPPGRTLIILLTDASGMLLPTIRSRAQTIRFAALDPKLVYQQLVKRGIDAASAKRAAVVSGGSLGSSMRWLEDGIVDAADQMIERLESLARSDGVSDLPDWFRRAADAYAAKQLERDKLSSKDQATREGLGLYLKLAADHFRRGLASVSDSDASSSDMLERFCSAIDAVALTEKYIDANVAISLAFQQLVSSLERTFAAPAASL